MPKATDPIVSIDRSKKIPVYTVRKLLTDAETEDIKAHFIEQKQYPVVLKEDADVYTEDGNILLRFRKNVLSKEAIDSAYEGMKDFVYRTTRDRGIASGSPKGLATGEKNAVRSNILGYFDKWSIGQRATFKRSGVKAPGSCRYCTFNVRHPEKWKYITPLVKEIDAQYKALCPTEHASQLRAAKKTPFHITGTAFSTVTTNLNFRTAAHQDTGDWPEGLGNLVVIERGDKYEGAYTGFPQYGVGVDVRTGDFLAMDVHQVHGNTPKVPDTDNSIRLSLVNYLREKIVTRCQNQPLYDAQKLEKKLQAYRDNKSRKNAAAKAKGRGTRKIKRQSQTKM
jgi:hypothetical protein